MCICIIICKHACWVASVASDVFWDPMDYSPQDFSVHRDSPGKNTGVDCHALLQGIFPTQGSPGGGHDKDGTWVSCIAGRVLTIWATREAFLINMLLQVRNPIILCLPSSLLSLDPEIASKQKAKAIVKLTWFLFSWGLWQRGNQFSLHVGNCFFDLLLLL